MELSMRLYRFRFESGPSDIRAAPGNIPAQDQPVFRGKSVLHLLEANSAGRTGCDTGGRFAFCYPLGAQVALCHWKENQRHLVAQHSEGAGEHTTPATGAS